MDWASAIAGFVAGLLGGYAIKIAIDARRTTNVTQSVDHQGTVNQTGNFSGGDLAGRDINKGSE